VTYAQDDALVEQGLRCIAEEVLRAWQEADNNG
jgi:hypothetical protein